MQLNDVYPHNSVENAETGILICDPRVEAAGFVQSRLISKISNLSVAILGLHASSLMRITIGLSSTAGHLLPLTETGVIAWKPTVGYSGMENLTEFAGSPASIFCFSRQYTVFVVWFTVTT